MPLLSKPLPVFGILAAIIVLIFLLPKKCHSTDEPPHSTLTAQDEAILKNFTITRDFAYGENDKQKMDIYAPRETKGAPIILFLHGGGYKIGDKSSRLGFINKVTRWVPQGLIVISMNTRLFPEADGYTQADDFAHAIVAVQKHAVEWGGDPKKLIIMGHSSAGHLVSLLTAKPSLVYDLGGLPWLGGLSLDSSSMDIPQTMASGHPGFFDEAFGKDPDMWVKSSPINNLSSESLPLFAACSLQRGDRPCQKVMDYSKAAKIYGARVDVFPVDYDHGQVNDRLGTDCDYTKEAEKFMASLDKEVEKRLGSGQNKP